MTEIQHELIMPNKDLPFKMFLFEGRDGNYIREKHWHRSIEIFAVFQGTLEFYLNDQEYLLEILLLSIPTKCIPFMHQKKI